MTKVDAEAQTIEPRIRARRTSLAHDRRRRRLWILAVLGGVVLMLGATVGAFFTPLFDVDHIIVRGTRTLSADAVRGASGVERGDPLVLVRPGRTARRVERLPYIKTARVKRIFPGTVVITVTERVPVAWTTGDDQAAAVIDATGRVLAVTDTPPAGLPRVTGFTQIPAPGTPVQPAGVVAALAELPPGLRSLIATMVWDGSELTLTLVDGLQVRLGDPADIRAKGAVAEAVIDRSAPGTKVVDVRVPTSPVSK